MLIATFLFHIRSVAYSKFLLSTILSFNFAACKAALLQMLAISAPANIRMIKHFTKHWSY